MPVKFDQGRKKDYKGNIKKIPFKMDIGMLNNLVGFVVKISPSVSRKSLKLMRSFFDLLDKSIYEVDDRKYERIKFIERALEARLKYSMDNRSLIIEHCRTVSDDNAEIIRNIHRYEKLNFEQLQAITNMMQDRVQFSFLEEWKANAIRTAERLESGDYDTYRELIAEAEATSKELIGQMRRNRVVSTKQTLSLGEDFEEKVTEMATSLKNPARIMKTGIRALNEIIVKGYRSRRLYMYVGLPGGYKSWILLKAAIDIKKYNFGMVGKKEGARKTVLLITMENDIEETVERMFNLTVTGDDIRNYEVSDIVKKLREEGELNISSDGDIDIILQYYPDHTICVDDIYTIIEDLEDDNREIVALIMDYIKKLRSSERPHDEKDELKRVTNELKALATELDIPVISAHQLNREAASRVDAEIEAGHADSTRKIGRGQVGSAWEVVENADWICVINLETDPATGAKFLTFKRVKLRYRYDSDLTYFTHPFSEDNSIQLIDDVNLPESVSRTTLASDFENAEIKRNKGRRSATEREVLSDDEASKYLDFEVVRSKHQRKAS